MSHFTKLLAANAITKHDGRTLWRYNLDAHFFNSLQNHLRNTPRLAAIDARDCALYYAAWWKCAYDGGSPSKQEIFTTIANKQAFDEDAFFQYAKQGARLLGVRWIRNANTQYFRTLLLQGGLPVRHIGKNKGAYTCFLERILEINPKTIDDFAFDFSITSLLPRSSRNDEIYACCLQVVKAINEEDDEYLSLLEKDATINEISARLKIKKRSLAHIRNKGRVRSFWVLEPAKKSIRLYLSFPEMDETTFANSLLNLRDDASELSYEYKLYYNQKVICKFIRNSANRYAVLWMGTTPMTWDGTDQRPELYLLGADGQRHDCGHLLGTLPTLQRPTLWTRYSDGQWLMQKGRHATEATAMVLYPEEFHAERDDESGLIEVREEILYSREFEGSFCLRKDDEAMIFRTGCNGFDWYVADERPVWLQKANMPVVRSKPEIMLCNSNGELLIPTTKQWRSKGQQSWRSWADPMPRGLIEYGVELNGVREEGCIFNIGSLQLESYNAQLHEARLRITNSEFDLQINECDLLSVTVLSNGDVQLTCTNTAKRPSAISASLRLASQSKGVQFEITPLFSGVELINNDETIVSNAAKLQLGNLYGYRLLTDANPLLVRLYNTKRTDIVLSENLTELSLPFMRFDEKVSQLFSLSDPLDGRAEVQIEVWRDGERATSPIRTYSVQRYTQRVECNLDDAGEPLIKTEGFNGELYAVPLECESNAIALTELVKTDNGYRFGQKPQNNKYIVFAGENNRSSLKPAFLDISRSHNTSVTAERMARLNAYRLQLLEGSPESEAWQQILAYYEISVGNNLPFATFELLRACSFSSLLAARLFVYLATYGSSEKFATSECPQIEGDLGFCFHWVAAQHWQEAMDWAGCEFGTRDFKIVSEVVNAIYTNQHPVTHFSQLRRFVIEDQKLVNDGTISLHQKLNSVRASLGERVLRGIPRQCPPIPEQYANSLSQVTATDNVMLLLKSPLAVALSIAGKSDCLWCADGEHIRRNVRYSQQLHPDWYGYAVCHYLSKI